MVRPASQEEIWTSRTAMLNTKIIAMLGPASMSTECLRALLANNVSVYRLNASHGTWAEHASSIQRVRKMAALMGLEVAILLDLQGPKIRLGEFEGGGSNLKAGSFFMITVKNILGTNSALPRTMRTSQWSPGRSRGRAGAGESSVYPKGHHRTRSGARQSCYHCDSNAGIHDRKSISKPGRSE